MNQRHTHSRGQKGNVTIEGAIVLLPFCVFLIGIINCSMAYFFVDMIQDRAQMAVRAASLNPSDSVAATNIVLYGSRTAPSPQPARALLGLSPSDVNLVRLGTGTEADRVQLTISNYQLPFFIPGMPSSILGASVVDSAFVEVP